MTREPEKNTDKPESGVLSHSLPPTKAASEGEALSLDKLNATHKAKSSVPEKLSQPTSNFLTKIWRAQKAAQASESSVYESVQPSREELPLEESGNKPPEIKTEQEIEETQVDLSQNYDNHQIAGKSEQTDTREGVREWPKEVLEKSNEEGGLETNANEVSIPKVSPEADARSKNLRQVAIERYQKVKEEQKLKVERGGTFRQSDPRAAGKNVGDESGENLTSLGKDDSALESLHRSSFATLPILAKPEPSKPSLLTQSFRMVGAHPLLFVCFGGAVLGLLVYDAFHLGLQSSFDTKKGHELLSSGDLEGAKSKLDEAIRTDSNKVEAYVDRANYFAKINRPADSIADLTRALEIAPSNLRALACRAQIELASGLLANAIIDYKKLANLKGKLSAFDLAFLGEAYLKDGQYTNALSSFSKSLEQRPNDSETLLNRAESYRALGQFHSAINDCNEVIKTEKKSYEASILKAGCEDELFQHKQALLDINRAIQISPARPEAYLYRASFFAKAKNFASAEKDYVLASKFKVGKGEAFYQRAMYFALKGDHAKAIHQFSLIEDELKNEPKHEPEHKPMYQSKYKEDQHTLALTPSFYIERSNIYFLNKDYEHAMADLQKAQLLDQGYKTKCWFGLAECYAAKKDYKNALAQLTHVISDEPRSYLALVRHGHYSRLAGNQMTALADLFKAIELDPENPSAYVERGDYYLQNKQPNIALVDYQKALVLAPEFPQLKQKVEKLLFDAKPKHNAKALELDLEATQINSNDPQKLKVIGYKALVNGDNDLAQAAFSRAIRLKPNDASLRLYLAHALIKTEETEEAIRQFYSWESLANPDASSELAFARLLPRESDLAQDLIEHIAERNRTNCKTLIEIAQTSKDLGYKLLAASALDFASRVANDEQLLEINRMRGSIHLPPEPVKVKTNDAG